MALVLGANEVGSAIAVGLHRAGHGVVLIDEADPAWHRRGMAFVDAWYLGGATLDGEEAVFCSNVRSIPIVLDRGRAIAATTWSWPGVDAALRSDVIVDARMRRAGPGLLVTDAIDRPLTIGVGPGFRVGEHVDAAVETAPGPDLGRLVLAHCTIAERRPPPVLGGAGRERFVHAEEGGRFATSRKIGDEVVAGERIGTLGAETIRAPIRGVLRGLSARGARVSASCALAEVDPRGDPALCFGIEDRPRAIATSVVAMVVEGRTNARERIPGSGV